MGSEIVGTYYVGSEKYYLYGCYHNMTPDNEYDFYDIYDSAGNCLNEGDPFWGMPFPMEMAEYIESIPDITGSMSC
jgi:hypothetical protein